MRSKKPTRVSVEQVRIAREGNDAVVDHADAGISGAHLAIGPEIATMTDAEIVDLYNGILESQHRLLAEWDKTVIEEPLGEKQIDYHEDCDQWVPRGDVLRCIMTKYHHIDDKIVTRRIRPDAHGSCGLGHENRVRSRGIHTRESKGQNPKAQAEEALTLHNTDVGFRSRSKRPVWDWHRTGIEPLNVGIRRRHLRGRWHEAGPQNDKPV